MTESAVGAVSVLRQQRALIAKSIDGLSDEALLDIPDRHRNNILWNIGHLIVSQQRLCYSLSGLDMYIPESMVPGFMPGTSPADWSETPDIGQIKSFLVELPERFAEDVAAGIFQEYKGYTTSTGFELITFKDGVAFNQFHEGVHVGVVLGLKKYVSG